MEKNIILGTQKNYKTETYKSIGERIASSNTVVSIAELFSALMGEDITPEQTLVIINTMLALSALLMPFDMPIVARIICLAWFVTGLVHCKAKGLK